MGREMGGNEVEVEKLSNIRGKTILVRVDILFNLGSFWGYCLWLERVILNIYVY